MSERFTHRDDGVELALGPAEAALLRDLSNQVVAVVIGPEAELGANPVRDRLFPRAYDDPTEDSAESEWQSAVRPDLVRAKSQALEGLLADLDRGRKGQGSGVVVSLAEARLEVWVAALNDLRLALAVSIGLTEEHQEVPDDHPQAPMFDAYHWLTYLQGELIEEMIGPLGF